MVDYLVDYLADTGARHIFGVDGANIEDLYDAAHFNTRVTAVLAKHEFSAATMADGYARAGTPAGFGVVCATSGGGSLNLVPGLGESLASRIPVLALVGQPPSTLDGTGSFQDTSGRNGSPDAAQLFSAVSVFCRRVTEPTDIVTALPQAVAAARTGGPAVLLIPKDIQQSALAPCHASVPTDAANSAQPDDVQLIVRALRAVRGQVTIIAGEQVARDDARDQLEELRSTLRARVATVPDAKDASGSAIGVTGVMGHPGVAAAIAQSDVCLLVGTRLPVTSRSGLEGALQHARTLSIGSAPPFVQSTHLHTDNLRTSLSELVRAFTGEGGPAERHTPDSAARTELMPPTLRGNGIGYRSAMAALNGALPDGTDIVVDAGNTGAAAVHHLPVRRDGRFVVALGMGGMGYSFGAGIGMALARGRRTVVIAGDGAFFMHGMEIHTAVQYRLPVTFVLFNNNAHAMCVTREKLFYEALYSYNRFSASSLGAGLAAMFPGLPSVDVDAIAELPNALRHALAVDGPSVVSIECSADEIPPFAPFLTPNSEEMCADVTACA